MYFNFHSRINDIVIRVKADNKEEASKILHEYIKDSIDEVFFVTVQEDGKVKDECRS